MLAVIHSSSQAWISTPFTVPPCNKCGEALRLLIQTFDPIDGEFTFFSILHRARARAFSLSLSQLCVTEFPSLERVIYVFVCNKSECSNTTGCVFSAVSLCDITDLLPSFLPSLTHSWFVLRSQRLAQDNPAPSAPPPTQPDIIVPIAAPPAVVKPPAAKPAPLFDVDWGDEGDSAAPETPDIDALLRERGTALSMLQHYWTRESLCVWCPLSIDSAAAAAPAAATTTTTRTPVAREQKAEAAAAEEYETVTGDDIFPAYYLEVASEPAPPPKPQKELKVVETLPAEAGETWADEGYERATSRCA